MSFIRRLLAPLAGVVAAIVGSLLHQDPEVISAMSEAARQILAPTPSNGAGSGRPLLDAASRELRARSYVDFGASCLLAWQAAGTGITLRLRLDGWIHTLVILFRTNKQFQSQTALAGASLSSVLLLGSPETQRAAVDLLDSLAEELRHLGRCKQGSPEAVQVFDRGSAALGPKFVAWRLAARKDLEVD